MSAPAAIVDSSTAALLASSIVLSKSAPACHSISLIMDNGVYSAIHKSLKTAQIPFDDNHFDSTVVTDTVSEIPPQLKTWLSGGDSDMNISTVSRWEILKSGFTFMASVIRMVPAGVFDAKPLSEMTMGDILTLLLTKLNDEARIEEGKHVISSAADPPQLIAKRRLFSEASTHIYMVSNNLKNSGLHDLRWTAVTPTPASGYCTIC